jgi:uncharacterized membrane protein
MKYFIAYLATLILFVSVDLAWLGVVARRFYRAQLAGLIADRFDVRAATVFYLVYPLGVVVFAVAPTLESGVWPHAVLWGAMFGFFAYATYDLTNLATLRDWPLRLTLVDMLWGTSLTALAALCGHLLSRSVWS